MHNWTVIGVLGGGFEFRETDIHAVDEVRRMADAGLIRTPVGNHALGLCVAAMVMPLPWMIL